MAKYVYSELKAREIRLFKLQPAEDECSEIMCDIFTSHSPQNPNTRPYPTNGPASVGDLTFEPWQAH